MKRVMRKSLSWLLSVVMVFGVVTVCNVNCTKANAASDVIERALSWALDIANDDTHQYVLGASHGDEGVNYDCSSFVSWAIRHAGLDVPISTTFVMRNNFEPYGFEWIEWSSIGSYNNLQRGDILLDESTHVEFYYGDGKILGAHNSKSGISLSNYYNNYNGVSWDGVLRHTGNNNFPGNEDTSYDVPVWLTADHKCDTYNSKGGKESDHYIAAEDDCYIEKVYDSGFCWVKYPITGGERWAYVWAGDFDIPKKSIKTDIGTDFYAYIINTSAWKMAAVVNDNVQLQSENADRNQIWYFERQGDNSYKITNVATGKCLDVNNGESNNGTNVLSFNNNDNDNQRWYFSSNDGAYVLHPKHAVNMSLDVNAGSAEDGANIQIWETNGTTAQTFSVWKFENAPNKPTVYSDSTIYLEGSNVKLNWGECAFATSFIVEVWYNNGNGAERIKCDTTTALEYTLNNLQSGKYGIYVTSVNPNGRTVSGIYNFFVSKDIGNSFYASIILNQNWLSLQDKNGNALVDSGSSSMNEVWYFVKADNNFGYYIKNCETNQYLELDDSVDENGHNVKTSNYNGNNSQIWNVLGVGSGSYALKPKCAVRSLDIDPNSNNAYIWDLVYNSNQKFAVWIYDTFNVEFDMNGGSGIVENQTKVHVHDLIIPEVKPMRTGYEFVGWNTDKSAVTAEYQPGDTYTTDSDTTLYAIWKIIINNTSVINSDKVQIGDKVRIAAAGNGGTAPYKYAYYYKRSTNSTWKTLGTEWGTNSSVAFAPTAEASYDIKVVVKDSTGATAEKLFTVTAVKELELTNVSVVGREKIKLGTAIPMIGKAVGGAGDYTYSFYFKRSTNTAWKLLGNKFTSTASARFKPTATGTYDIRIDVKDSTGTVVKKLFTATVK